MKKYTIHLVVLFCLLSASVKSQQQINSLYFLDNAPIRHTLNPALQPMSGFYLSLPILGYTQMGLGNNSFTLSSLNSTKDEVFKSLRPTTLLNQHLQFNLFGFGFRAKENYITLGVTAKQELNIGLPRDFFKLLMYGNVSVVDGLPVLENNVFDFKSMSFGMQAYTEVALGYARNLNDKWSMGLKLKYLHGLGVSNAYFENFTLVTGIDQWKLDAKGVLNYASPMALNIGNNLSSLNFGAVSDYMDFVKPSGIGGAVDVGLTYKPFKFLTVGASVTDLGLIRWSKHVKNSIVTTDYSFDGIGTLNANDLFDGIDSEALIDTLITNLDKSITNANTSNIFTTSTSPTVNVSAEAGILKNAITFGLLSSSRFYNKKLYQDITASINLKPINTFNLSLSYSLLNGRTSNIGAGLGFRFLGIFNGFFTADVISLHSTRIPYSLIGVDASNFASIPLIGSRLSTSDGFKVPYKIDRFNFAFGFNVVIGNKQDKDKDGVSNRKDNCPDTPKGVIVDKHGCPVDTDGDKIPDFLDKCPDTPKEAYTTIDADGCPIDTDGDGVADYLDKCPETPIAAFGKIDSSGCPLDSDSDGIADYIDKCLDTPQAVKVDTFGCPIDTDGDYVPDYLDQCPETPIAARGLIDSLGCPIDSDKDGVFDYLDKCPNTPLLARAMVDSTGCPKDTDGDGVTDYLDKCPDTLLEAKGFVDENGCPRDTDGDGVLDYLDKCPRLAGVASNKGCPEIKKEIRQLFQKALQGIQFETGKSNIKPVSFKILDDVAKVLFENPTYLVEIQGHTDNVGKKDANKTLSENRAQAVRDYLIKKGIDQKRMTASGYGDTKPVLPNTTSANRAKNRRVEFVVSFEEVFEQVVE